MGAPWNDDHVGVKSCYDIRAIGGGSNNKKVDRATKLSLALSLALAEGYPVSKDDSPDFRRLVEEARDAQPHNGDPDTVAPQIQIKRRRLEADPHSKCYGKGALGPQPPIFPVSAPISSFRS